MANLIYAAIASLDGYVADEEGRFDWATPDEEVHRFVNDLERPIGTYLYGRRMYEVMSFWETASFPDQPYLEDYAGIWRAAVKVVYSSTLEAPTTARTRLESSFDPAEVRAMKASSSRDLSIGGPTIAGEALRHGLVDEVRVLLAPEIVGGGTRALPDDVFLSLELLDERRFANGFVHVRYATTRG